MQRAGTEPLPLPPLCRICKAKTSKSTGTEQTPSESGSTVATEKPSWIPVRVQDLPVIPEVPNRTLADTESVTTSESLSVDPHTQSIFSFSLPASPVSTENSIKTKTFHTPLSISPVSTISISYSIPSPLSPISTTMSQQNMPIPGSRDTPKFDENEPTELLRFIDRMEDLFQKHLTVVLSDEDKKKAIGKYMSARTEAEWKVLPSFSDQNKSWSDFKKEVITSYPEAFNLQRGTIATLDKICNEYRGSARVSVTELTELAALVCKFRAEATKLLTPPAVLSS